MYYLLDLHSFHSLILVRFGMEKLMVEECLLIQKLNIWIFGKQQGQC